MVDQVGDSVSAENILRAVLESPRDILILASDREHNYLAFNEAHRRAVKARLGVDIAVGMNVLDLMREPMRTGAKVLVDRALAGEQVKAVHEIGVGTPLENTYIEITHCPILGSDGTVIGQTAFHQDITVERRMRYELELHRAKLERLIDERTAALRRSEALYRTLVQTAPVAVLVHRGDTLLYANPAAVALAGERDASSLLGRRLSDLVSPSVEPSSTATRVEREIRTADGRSTVVEWTSKEVDFEGAPATLSLAEDVSFRKEAEAERQRVEEQMRETQRLESLGILAGGIAHDFNNLLVGIVGNADLALNGLRSGAVDANLSLQLRRIKTASLRAAELTGQMLAYAGKGRFVLRAIDLNELIREIADLMTVSVPRDAQLVLDLAPNLPTIEGDATQVRQILLNLTTNGAEALAYKGGEITIHTSVVSNSSTSPQAPLPPGRYVRVVVTDTGCGMDDAIREKIFEPFFTTKARGRGLGLAAVRGIVRSHEGAIDVVSSIGDGSTFRVFFPVSEHAPAAADPPAAADWCATGTIVVADDQPRVRQVLAMMLREIGFEVLEAVSASSCLEVYRAEAEAVDALIVDLEMPGGGGREVVRMLRAEGYRVPIVISSGYTEEVIGNELRADARLSFLEKPFEWTALVRALKRAMGAA